MKNDKLTFGQRAADSMKVALASWPALFITLIYLVAHISTSGFGHDQSPYFRLNLGLSCFAALQCFILLIANKRGEQISAEIAEHTAHNTDEIRRLVEEVKDNTDRLEAIAKELIRAVPEAQEPPEL